MYRLNVGFFAVHNNILSKWLQCPLFIAIFALFCPLTILGIVLDGFFLEPLNGDRTFHLNTVYEILTSASSRLPPALPRFLTGIWQPDEVVRACCCGVDIFDGSLPFRITRSGIAWLYAAYCSKAAPEPWIRFPLPPEELENAEVYRQPLQSDCLCFTCKRHNRGYISHLHSVNEMLAHILLMM